MHSPNMEVCDVYIFHNLTIGSGLGLGLGLELETNLETGFK